MSFNGAKVKNLKRRLVYVGKVRLQTLIGMPIKGRMPQGRDALLPAMPDQIDLALRNTQSVASCS